MSRIDDSLRDAPVMDRAGYPYMIHPLTDGVPRAEPDLLREWTEWAMQQDLVADADLLVAPEAMALPLAVPLAMAADLPYVVVRKRPYGLPGERSFTAETGYGGSTFYLNDIRTGDRPLVIDDIISTGGTLGALLEGLQAVGAPAVGALVFVQKGADGPDFGVPVRAMRRVTVEAASVQIGAGPPPRG